VTVPCKQDSGLIQHADFLWWYAEGGRITLGIRWISINKKVGVFCVDLPEVGEVLREGNIFCSVHTLTDTLLLKMPLTGWVLGVNSELETNPEILEKEGLISGWLIKLRKTT